MNNQRKTERARRGWNRWIAVFALTLLTGCGTTANHTKAVKRTIVYGGVYVDGVMIHDGAAKEDFSKWLIAIGSSHAGWARTGELTVSARDAFMRRAVTAGAVGG